MVDPNNRKIKNLFISKGFQFKIIMTSMIYMILVMVVTIGAVLYPMINDMMSSTDLNTQYKAAQNFLVLARLMPSMMVLFSVFFIHQLFITHRVSGPLVNFTNTFKRLANADFSRKIFLRKGDYLKPECDAINGMIDGLSDKFRVFEKDHDRVIHVLEEALMSITDPNVREDIQHLLYDLKEKNLHIP